MPPPSSKKKPQQMFQGIECRTFIYKGLNRFWGQRVGSGHTCVMILIHDFHILAIFRKCLTLDPHIFSLRLSSLFSATTQRQECMQV